MINLDILSEIRDILVVISTFIVPFIALQTNIWNQNHVIGKNKDQWLTILRKCSYVNKGFEQINSYNHDVYNRYSKFLNGILIVSLIASLIVFTGSIIELIITAELKKFIPESISAVIYLSGISTVLVYFKKYDSNIASKDLLKPQFSDDMRIREQSRDVLFRYYLLAGMISGINICILPTVCNLILVGMLSSNILSYTYFLIGIVVSIVFLLRLKKIISLFYFESITEIMDSNRHQFPWVIIKTQCDIITGQLMDILNKDTITLNEDDRLKTVLWSKIESLEIRKTV